jgi:hypothetical protein
MLAPISDVYQLSQGIFADLGRPLNRFRTSDLIETGKGTHGSKRVHPYDSKNMCGWANRFLCAVAGETVLFARQRTLQIFSELNSLNCKVTWIDGEEYIPRWFPSGNWSRRFPEFPFGG